MDIELKTVYPVVSGANFGEWLSLLCYRAEYDLSTQAAGGLMRYTVSRVGVKVAEIETLPVGERLKVRTVRIGFEADGPRSIPGFIGLYGAGLSSDFGVTLETGIDSGVMTWALDGFDFGATGLPPMPQTAETSAPQLFDFDADCAEVLDHFAGKPTGEGLTRVRKFDHVEGDNVYHVEVAAVNMHDALPGISCHVTLEREYMHVALISLTQEKPGRCHAKYIPLADKITSPLFYRDDPDMLKRWNTRQNGLYTAQQLGFEVWKRAILDWPTRKATDAPQPSQTSTGSGQHDTPSGLYSADNPVWNSLNSTGKANPGAVLTGLNSTGILKLTEPAEISAGDDLDSLIHRIQTNGLGRKPESDLEMAAAWLAWHMTPKKVRPKLDTWLGDKFGLTEHHAPNLQSTTFHNYKRKVPSERLSSLKEN